jgi:putative lipoprotein
VRRWISVAVIAMAAMSLTACGGDDPAVSGEVTKRDRSGLPENAVVTVELRDVSLADALAKALSTDIIELKGSQLPVAYELAYDADEIDERHTYTVFSRIEADGNLLYITETAYPVITNGVTEDVEVVVVPTG